MIKIDISGMADGEYEFNLKTPLKTVECHFEEFFGEISSHVIVTKLKNRYNVKVHAEAPARMICDRSLKEFEEKITADFELVYKADTKLFLEAGHNIENDKEILIREDYKYIDISSVVVEHLALKLPMKRVAPEFRDKDIDEIYPEISSDKIKKGETIDERWSKLKNIKIN